MNIITALQTIKGIQEGINQHLHTPFGRSDHRAGLRKAHRRGSVLGDVLHVLAGGRPADGQVPVRLGPQHVERAVQPEQRVAGAVPAGT